MNKLIIIVVVVAFLGAFVLVSNAKEKAKKEAEEKKETCKPLNFTEYELKKQTIADKLSNEWENAPATTQELQEHGSMYKNHRQFSLADEYRNEAILAGVQNDLPSIIKYVFYKKAEEEIKEQGFCKPSNI